MERTQIIKLTKKNIDLDNLEKVQKELGKDYEISYGKYEVSELKKAISDTSPVIIDGHIIIGYDPDGKFVDSNGGKVKIDKMVKAIIVEDEKQEPPQKTGDQFAIIGKRDWPVPLGLENIFSGLTVGEIFLPPHSAIFNFLNRTEDQKKKKIVSCLSGVNINLYESYGCIDNSIHEIGHLFWRDCVNGDEKKAFRRLFKNLRPSAIYEYEWERSDEEELFCTIYKWYVKSLLINRSFYNILEFEEPAGLALLQNIFDRIANDRQTQAVWSLSKDDVFEYLNPKFDVTSGKFIRRKDLFENIRDIELPTEILNDIDHFEDGVIFVNLGKAIVPVAGKKIDWAEMEKSRTHKYIRRLPDGKGGWKYFYKEPQRVAGGSGNGGGGDDSDNETTLKKHVKIIEGKEYNKKVISGDAGNVFVTYSHQPKNIEFKNKMINDMNQNLANGWWMASFGKEEDHLLSRVLNGQKPMSVISFWNNEDKDKFAHEKNIDKIDKKRFDIKIGEKEIIISRKGRLADLFDLDTLAEDYKKAGISTDISTAKDREISSYSDDWDAQDAGSKIEYWETGLILGYPIENTISLYKGGIK